jgi:hypothetical protein
MGVRAFSAGIFATTVGVGGFGDGATLATTGEEGAGLAAVPELGGTPVAAVVPDDPGVAVHPDATRAMTARAVPPNRMP